MAVCRSLERSNFLNHVPQLVGLSNCLEKQTLSLEISSDMKQPKENGQNIRIGRLEVGMSPNTCTPTSGDCIVLKTSLEYMSWIFKSI